MTRSQVRSRGISKKLTRRPVRSLAQHQRGATVVEAPYSSSPIRGQQYGRDRGPRGGGHAGRDQVRARTEYDDLRDPATEPPQHPRGYLTHPGAQGRPDNGVFREQQNAPF